MSSLLPLVLCLFSRIGFSIPTVRRFSSSVVGSRLCAFPLIHICSRRRPLTRMHSARLESTKLFFVGPRTGHADQISYHRVRRHNIYCIVRDDCSHFELPGTRYMILLYAHRNEKVRRTVKMEDTRKIESLDGIEFTVLIRMVGGK